MERRGGELTAFLDWATTTLATCTSASPPPSAAASAALLDSDEAPPRAASVVAASIARSSAAGAASDASPDNGEGASGTAATRTFLAAGVMQALVEVAKHGHRDTLVGVGLADVFSRVIAISNTSGVGASASGGEDEPEAARDASVVLTSTGEASGEHVSMIVCVDIASPTSLHRDDAMPLIFATFCAAGASSIAGGPKLRASPVLRKLTVKLATRTGLAYLPPRVAAWRCVSCGGSFVRASARVYETLRPTIAGTNEASAHCLITSQLLG
jgi:hypothetical protein